MSIFSKMKEDLRALEEQETAEETVLNGEPDEPLTPEEEALMDFFVDLSDKTDSFLDALEELLDTFGEGIARLIAPIPGEMRENEEDKPEVETYCQEELVN